MRLDEVSCVEAGDHDDAEKLAAGKDESHDVFRVECVCVHQCAGVFVEGCGHVFGDMKVECLLES